MGQLKNYKSPSGSFRHWNISSATNKEPFYWVSPYFEVNENTNNDGRERVFGYLSLSYDLTENWSVSGYARSDFYNDRRERRVARGHVNNSLYAQDLISTREDNYQILSEYDATFGEIDVSTTVGGNVRYDQLQLESIETVGGISAPGFFNIQASKGRPSVEDRTEEVLIYAAFGSVNLGYESTIFLDASLRNDWSSTLPADNNSYLYPSVSASFVFSEVLPENQVVNFGKLRLGWSQVGNATDPYRLSTTYAPQDNYGNTPIFSVPNALNNAALKPERTSSVEMGVDMELFNGRFKPDVTVYRSVSRSQIIDLPVTSTSGYSSAILNAGRIENKGIEVSADVSLFRSPDGFNWEVSANWAKNRNKVVELAAGQENYQIVSPADGNGVSLNARVGEPYGTLVGEAVARNENGERIVGDDGLYERETGQILGNIRPDFTGGVTNTFSYKGITLSALVDFRKGGDIFSVTSSTGMYAGLLQETVGTNDKGNPIRDPVSDGGGIRLEGVKENGEPNDTYVEAVDYFKNMYEGQHVYDGSYVKLREVSVGYTLPQSWFGAMPIRSLSVSLVGRNLSILHKNIPHVDPEATYGSGNVQGYESAQLPRTRTFGFKIEGSL
jgi:hypothetical protein